MSQLLTINEEKIVNKIYLIRGDKVMLDIDLAILYGVETRTLKQAVRRNIKRFPEDFMFELTRSENNSLRSQNVIIDKVEDSQRSQNVSLKGKHSKYLPFFKEFIPDMEFK